MPGERDVSEQQLNELLFSAVRWCCTLLVSGGMCGSSHVRCLGEGDDVVIHRHQRAPCCCTDVRAVVNAIREVDPELVVVTPVHNSSETIRAAVESVVMQRDVRGKVLHLVIDDGSDDDWLSKLGEAVDGRPTICFSTVFGGAVFARNTALDLVRRSAPRTRFIVRLDTDDIFWDSTVLRRIEHAFRRSVFSVRCGLRRPGQVLIGSNVQRRNGTVLPRPNLATGSLLDPDRLLDRLDGMAAGEPAAELPSCNVVIGPDVPATYPNVSSAEDHWLTVGLLLDPRVLVQVDEDLMHSSYSLSGALTRSNQRRDAYRRSRQALRRFAVSASTGWR